jgi:hypothetical protein
MDCAERGVTGARNQIVDRGQNAQSEEQRDYQSDNKPNFFHYKPFVRYHNPMKPPPDNPEFRKFTSAMRTIMSVSKAELKKREEAQKKRKRSKVSASPGSVASSSAVN